MRIVCPACAAAYEIPDGRLLPGRVVRCARCDTDWAPITETAAADPKPAVATLAPPPEPEPPLIETIAAERPEPPQVDEITASRGSDHLGALWAAWAVSFAVLLAALWFAYSARETVMHAWPPSTRAYAALGLAPKP